MILTLAMLGHDATYDTLADLEAFITDHRRHGELTAVVNDPMPNGYLVGGRLRVRRHLRALDHA